MILSNNYKSSIYSYYASNIIINFITQYNFEFLDLHDILKMRTRSKVPKTLIYLHKIIKVLEKKGLKRQKFIITTFSE